MPETRRSWKRRSAARPAELRQAALRLFSERGYSAATIEDVAAAAGVTVGTVYRYYSDKGALLRSLIEWAASVPLVDPATPPGGSDSEGLRLVLRGIWTVSRGEPHGGVLRILVGEGGHQPELVARYRDAVLEPAAGALVDRVRRAAAGVDPRLVARATLGHLLGASILAGAPPTIEALIPQLDPLDVTVERLIAGFAGPVPPGAKDVPQSGLRRFSGPESW